MRSSRSDCSAWSIELRYSDCEASRRFASSPRFLAAKAAATPTPATPAPTATLVTLILSAVPRPVSTCSSSSAATSSSSPSSASSASSSPSSASRSGAGGATTLDDGAAMAVDGPSSPRAPRPPPMPRTGVTSSAAASIDRHTKRGARLHTASARCRHRCRRTRRLPPTATSILLSAPSSASPTASPRGACIASGAAARRIAQVGVHRARAGAASGENAQAGAAMALSSSDTQRR